MELTLYNRILDAKKNGRKLLAVLLDPDKAISRHLADTWPTLQEAKPDLIFVGGSTGEKGVDDFVKQLKSVTSIPVVLFPGNPSQFTPNADALLFLSLLSGRNPEMLIGMQVASARQIQDSGIETISMGYILCDGGKQSSVEKVSQTKALCSLDEIIDTAIAGRLLGMKSIYLEAGSGASKPIAKDVIQAVRKQIDVPLIVGGGICSIEQMNNAFHAGADIVVIGNYFEQHIDQLKAFCDGRG